MAPLTRWIWILIIFLTACQTTSPYDAKTHTNLIHLKTETSTLIEKFDLDPALADSAEAAETTQAMKSAIDYEQGKNPKDGSTIKQLEIINHQYLEIIQQAREVKPKELGPRYFRNSALLLNQAFDIAIETEQSKIMTKR